MVETINVLGDLLGGLVDIIKFLGNGLATFIDFIINLPALSYQFIDIIPMPLKSVVLAFVGYVLFVIAMKVVSHFV